MLLVIFCLHNPNSPVSSCNDVWIHFTLVQLTQCFVEAWLTTQTDNKHTIQEAFFFHEQERSDHIISLRAIFLILLAGSVSFCSGSLCTWFSIMKVTDTLSRSLNSAESISGELLPRSGKPADQKCHNRSSQHSSPEDPVKDTEGTIAYARLTDANTDPNIEGGEKKGTFIMTSTLLATSIKVFNTWSLKSLWNEI